MLFPSPGAVYEWPCRVVIRGGAIESARHSQESRARGQIARHAFATLVTNEEYGRGALALVRSLRWTGTDGARSWCSRPARRSISTSSSGKAAASSRCSQPLVSDAFKKRHSREALHRAAPFNKGNKPAFHDPVDNFCKLELWKLTDYDKIVFLDADSLVVKPIDMLFGFPEFSGAPNVYETLADFHRLNSGVFVAEPSLATYESLVARLDQPGVFWRRTDQTFLETMFPDWHKLPYTFNTMQYVYFNLPELWVWKSIRVVHYQYEKPWAAENPKRHLLKPLIDLWWRMFEGAAPPDDLPVVKPEHRQGPDCVIVAVTGATGYVGRFIVKRLIAEGVTVRAWRRPSSDLTGLPDGHRVDRGRPRLAGVRRGARRRRRHARACGARACARPLSRRRGRRPRRASGS